MFQEKKCSEFNCWGCWLTHGLHEYAIYCIRSIVFFLLNFCCYVQYSMLHAIHCSMLPHSIEWVNERRIWYARAFASQIDLTHQNFIYRSFFSYDCDQHKHLHITQQTFSTSYTRKSWCWSTYSKYLQFFYHLEMAYIAFGLCLNHRQVSYRKHISISVFFSSSRIYEIMRRSGDNTNNGFSSN